MYVFSVNNGMSKSALSQTLQCEKNHLPQPNCLPASFREARKLIKPLLMPLERYDVCINDCIIYREQFSNFDTCPECEEPRKLKNLTQKSFTYMPIGPRLTRWFGTSNLAKLLYEKKLSTTGKLRDFTDGDLYARCFNEENVFGGFQEEKTVPLRIFTDGVNPNRNMCTQKSMWPIMLTWLNLPMQIRQLLGPMMLVAVIPSGKNGCEPKLDAYMGRLVEELLPLTEYPVYSIYDKAPIRVKVALLQYLCDIPAFSKLLHVAGHGAIRSCSYCKEEGHYCKHLHKTIHLSNRQFLDSSHPLRHAEGFPNKSSEAKPRPKPLEFAEERILREQYDNKPNNNQKMLHQRNTGLKGSHPFLKLPYHNRLEQMQPNGMHTVADFLNHIMDLLTGKEDHMKIRRSEESMSRFPDIWLPKGYDTENTEPPKKKQKTAKVSSVDPTLPPLPWTLSKEQIKEADRRASEIRYPDEVNISPGPHFTKPWTLRTMNSKLQFVKTGAFEWCIKDMLPKRQESTLFKVFDVIKRLISQDLDVNNLPRLQEDTHVVLSMLERDFPVSLQNLVTHLMHHIADGLSDNGPMYGRWLFPYERANGWLTRQGLQKVNQEATIMETYLIYDWCVYMYLSQKLSPSVDEDSSIHQAAEFIKSTLKGDSSYQKTVYCSKQTEISVD